MEHHRIYLDNAATSWPKPEEVYRAVEHYQRELGAPAGRSGYREAAEVSRLVERTRVDAAQFLGVDEPRRLSFTSGGTDSLNIALHGLLRPGDHVVTTAVEHNSVLRPLWQLRESRQIQVHIAPCDSAGIVDCDDLRQAMTDRTRLVVASQASNVTGAQQPIEEFGRIAHEYGARLLVDGAQAAGHLPVQLSNMPVDVWASSAHKGLLGPLGLGLLYVAPGVEDELVSFRQGGTGLASEDERQPAVLPHKYEAGNMNVPAIVGLGAAIRVLTARGIDQVVAHHRLLIKRLLKGLNELTEVRVFGPPADVLRAPIVSLCVDGYDPQEIAASLDAHRRIQARPGLHCAPLMHKAIGTFNAGGTVRFSLGLFNRAQDVDDLLSALMEMGSASLTTH